MVSCVKGHLLVRTKNNLTSSWNTWVRYMKKTAQIFWGTTARCRFTSSSRIRTSLSPSTMRQPHQDQRINFTKDMGARTITGRLTSCQTLTLNLELSHSNSLMDIRTRIVALKVGYRCWWTRLNTQTNTYIWVLHDLGYEYKHFFFRVRMIAQKRNPLLI